MQYRALCVLCFLAVGAVGRAAEVAVLEPDNWDAFAPQGKEVDAIYGDYVLRNEHLVAVVAQPLATRNANMTVRGVGGCLIDLTERAHPNDQLSAYYPGAGRFQFIGLEGKPAQVRITATGKPLGDKPPRGIFGRTVVLEIDAQPIEDRPRLTARYTLSDDSPHLLIETIFTNATDKPLEEELSDAIRADKTFTFGFDPATHCFWADDEWFRQAYGVVVPGYEVKGTGQRGTLLQLLKDGSNKLKLEPGQSHTMARTMFPAPSLLALRGTASQLAGVPVRKIELHAAADSALAQAKVSLQQGGQPYASGRTDREGKISFLFPEGAASATLQSIDGRKATVEIPASGDVNQPLACDEPSYVVGAITNAAGQPSPAKVSFAGKDGATDPDWGPDSGDTAVKNVHYTHNGSFRQAIAPGKYDVIVSYGPEHDAEFTTLDVPAGGEGALQAVLRRSVDTAGWVSADFHSHSSPSGDNTSSQLGRVQNLLCEHIEFAPCTEHNRIDTYVPHLKHLQIEHLMATCTGMELTGGLLPVNHQNAFPLLWKPRTQDGGAPVTDVDPVVQIQRLALWDAKSDKLVQMNHPNLPQILGDRNEDGQPDAGFERMFGFVDVIEVHPPQGIFDPPAKGQNGKLARNPIYHWMQMLNLGYRNAAVINTDSHYNFHESGYFRNFIKSSTDDPARIDTMEMVHQAEQGHVVLSTGPFLSVIATGLSADGKAAQAGPGDSLAATEGEVSLHIRVQCPNWHDVNRVQVFLNGRPAPELNFTRRTTPDRFSDQVVRFEATVPIALKGDAHLIVATIGEGLTLGPVMGPNYGSKLPPAAVSNPIFVDLDGAGFKPNGDLLDVPVAIAPDRKRTAP